MMPRCIFAVFLIQVCCCFPQRAVKLPEVNFSPAEEVNAHLQHKHSTRSINTVPKSQNTLEETIKEVEELISSDPNLPRLTRGEIVDILENLTKEEARKPKAIMVVKPYTPESDENSKSMEELYTKPPVTQIIGAEPFKKRKRTTTTTTTTTTTEQNIIETTTRKPYRGAPYSQKTSTVSQVKKEDSLRPLNRRRPSLATEKPMIVTTYHPRRPMRRRTTTTKHPNHKYPEDSNTNFVPSEGLRVVEPPKLSPTLNYDLERVVEAPKLSPALNYESERVVQAPELSPALNYDLERVVEDPKLSSSVNYDIERDVEASTLTSPNLNYDLEMMQAQEAQTVKPFKKIPPSEPSIEVIVPEHLKKVVSDLNLDNLEQMDYDAQKIKDILSSIGIQDIPETTSTTTTTSKPDASVVAENLSPEMKELLVTFGLLADPNQKSKDDRIDDSYKPEKAEINADSYMGFKPLPEEGPSTRSEMDELLAQFGLGRSARKEKSVTRRNENKEANFDVVPDLYKDVLQDIGLVERSARKIRANVVEKNEKQHVFTPSKYNEYATIKEIEKVERLKKLMTAIKELEKLNRTITQEDMKNVDIEELKQLLSSLNLSNEKSHQLDEEHAPNPINFDPGLTKNDVKRQEEEPKSSTATPEVAEESNTPNIKDLEDSFGGKKETTTTTQAPVETTTSLRKTGFYYLVDWNSFLDIDDQNGKRVNLRFQPTVGDPKRFFSVNVP